MSSAFALNHFIQNADGVSWTVLSLLLIGSLSSWYLIVLKSVSAWRQRRASQIFRARFWQANTLEDVAQHIHQYSDLQLVTSENSRPSLQPAAAKF